MDTPHSVNELQNLHVTKHSMYWEKLRQLTSHTALSNTVSITKQYCMGVYYVK